jgi:hypothetical protein
MKTHVILFGMSTGLGLFSLAAPSGAAVKGDSMHPATEDATHDAPHGPSSDAFPSHRFQLAPRDVRQGQVAVNFGLVQLALGGFNVAAELRYRTLWFEYSHGIDLTLNDAGGLGLSGAERQNNLHVFVPYTTGFGVGSTVLDELWLGVEFKTHRYEVSAPNGSATAYQTYSIGPVLGYKFFVWRGFHLNAYMRYWPNVASSLDSNRVALRSGATVVQHDAHDFGFFANVSVGYAFDL